MNLFSSEFYECKNPRFGRNVRTALVHQITGTADQADMTRRDAVHACKTLRFALIENPKSSTTTMNADQRVGGLAFNN